MILKMSHERKIIDIISDILNIKKREISNKTSMNNIDQWDSLKQIQIILAIEDEFNIRFNGDDLSNANSVEKLLKTIQKLKR
jgi:acyl carrier protein